MKINSFKKTITKKVILAFAITSLSISAQATDFISDAGGGPTFNGYTESTGIISISNSSSMTFQNSFLGNSSGDRFSATMGYGLNLVGNTVVYLNNLSLNNTDYNYLFINTGSKLYVDNALISSGGTEISVNSGATFIAPSFTGGVGFFVNGVGTYAEFAAYGLIYDGTISEVDTGGYWRSLGSSDIYRLRFEGGTIDLLMTSATDKIHFDFLTVRKDEDFHYDNIFKFSFTDDFIESIMTGDGYFDLTASNTIVIDSLSGSGTFSYDVTEFNDTYKWTVMDLGGDVYRITDIRLIPEPSTYAMIFGILALGLAIYRRRK